MSTTALIEPPEHLHDEPDEPLAAVPPLLDLVPVAGPPVFVLAAFGLVLLLLLVPPLALLATLAGVMFLVAATLVALAAVLAAPVLLVRRLRGHRLPRVSLPSLDGVEVRRV